MKIIANSEIRKKAIEILEKAWEELYDLDKDDSDIMNARWKIICIIHNIQEVTP